MNAQEQYAHYNGQIESIFALQDKCYARGLSIDFADDYGINFARRILGELKAKIDAFGAKAYPLSEKQASVIERAIEANRTGFEKIVAEAKASEDAKIVAEAKAISGVATSMDDIPDDVYQAARFVVRGQKSRFEAKVWLAEERASQDQHQARVDLYGNDGYGGPALSKAKAAWVALHEN